MANEEKIQGEIEGETQDDSYHVAVGDWEITVGSDIVDMLVSDDNTDSTAAQTEIGDIIKTVAKIATVSSAYVRTAVNRLLEERTNRHMAENVTDFLYDGLQAFLWLGRQKLVAGSRLYNVAAIYKDIITLGNIKDAGRLSNAYNQLKMLADGMKKSEVK